MVGKRIQIQNILAISAIYFALLQTGYDFYKYEKSHEVIDMLSNFRDSQNKLGFFCSARQDTCEVYPYWPRASILETAVFYIDFTSFQFREFTKFKTHIMSMDNLKKEERNADFWNWIVGFPAALKQVLSDKNFQAYFEWECGWIKQQNCAYAEALDTVQKYFDVCGQRYHLPVTDIQIVLNPIKCAYSADYHIFGNSMLFTSGVFRAEAVLHELLHPIAHHIVISNREEVLRCDLSDLEIDKSYYLTNDDVGRLNAFEEYFVRRLTARMVADFPPQDLSDFLAEILLGA